jgi:hypothetical protein
MEEAQPVWKVGAVWGENAGVGNSPTSCRASELPLWASARSVWFGLSLDGCELTSGFQTSGQAFMEKACAVSSFSKRNSGLQTPNLMSGI